MNRNVLLTCLLLSGCSTAPVSHQDLAGSLDALGLRTSFPKPFTIDDRAEAKNENIDVVNLSARSADGRIVRVERLNGASPSQAQNFIKDRIFQLESIYEPLRDPYFSILTKNTVCPPKFQPIKESEKRGVSELFVLKLYANDRLTYGACTPDQAVYRAVIGMLHCPSSGSLFILETFTPLGSFDKKDDQSILTMQCR